METIKNWAEHFAVSVILAGALACAAFGLVMACEAIACAHGLAAGVTVEIGCLVGFFWTVQRTIKA